MSRRENGPLSPRSRSALRDGELGATLLRRAGQSGGDPDKGRFEVKAGRVDAVVIVVDEERKLEARFTPKLGS